MEIRHEEGENTSLKDCLKIADDLLRDRHRIIDHENIAKALRIVADVIERRMVIDGDDLERTLYTMRCAHEGLRVRVLDDIFQGLEEEEGEI